jgi:CDP-glucose 4,6-dehydratase
VEELVTKAVAAWGSGEWSAEGSGQQPHEAGLLQLDISKVLSRLPWKPKLNAQQAIEWSIGWYKEFYAKGSDARSLIQQQIRDYTTYEQL